MNNNEVAQNNTESKATAIGKSARKPRQPKKAQGNAGNNGAELTKRLATPFSANAIFFKPQKVEGNRALAVAYLDARSVMDRLDDVVGPGAWQDEYQVLPDGSVMCRLSLKVRDEWITKCDVGTRSDQPDEGDQQKAAFTDALKRAAVKFGIGRYLYRLPKQWIGYDSQRRWFTESPRLPAWALPDGQAPIRTKPDIRADTAVDQLPAEQPDQSGSSNTCLSPSTFALSLCSPLSADTQQATFPGLLGPRQRSERCKWGDFLGRSGRLMAPADAAPRISLSSRTTRGTLRYAMCMRCRMGPCPAPPAAKDQPLGPPLPSPIHPSDAQAR